MREKEIEIETEICRTCIRKTFMWKNKPQLGDYKRTIYPLFHFFINRERTWYTCIRVYYMLISRHY